MMNFQNGLNTDIKRYQVGKYHSRKAVRISSAGNNYKGTLVIILLGNVSEML